MEGDETGPSAPVGRTDRTTATARERIARDKELWLVEFEKHRDVGRACTAIGVGRTTVYNWRDADPEFYRAWRACFISQVDELEASMFTRAVHGTKNPIFFKDQQVGERQEWESSLSMFMLEKSRKHLYGKDAEGDIDPNDTAKKLREALAEMENRVPESADPPPEDVE